MPQLQPRRSRAFACLMAILVLLLALGVFLLVIGLITQPFAAPFRSHL